MRITVVQGAFLPVPPLRGGALEKAWLGLGQEFARAGHEVTHISRHCDGLPAEEVIADVRHRRVAGFDYPRSLVALKIRDFLFSRRVLRTLGSADILVTHTFWLPILANSSKHGRIYVHVARYPKGQMKFYLRAARLQAVSHPVAEAIRQQAPGMARRVKCLPLPVPGESFSSNGSLRTDSSKFILYAGRIHPEKGLDLLVRAFARQTDLHEQGWRLQIVGPWKVEQGGAGEAYLARLKDLGANLGDRLEFREPAFDQAALREMYESTALFVYPSLAEKGETFGLAPLEAMAAGCPALVSGLECFREFIEDGTNGWTFDHRTEDSARALGTKLAEILGNPLNRAEASIRARATAERFSLNRVAKLYLEDFAELVASQDHG